APPGEYRLMPMQCVRRLGGKPDSGWRFRSLIDSRDRIAQALVGQILPTEPQYMERLAIATDPHRHRVTRSGKRTRGQLAADRSLVFRHAVAQFTTVSTRSAVSWM